MAPAGDVIISDVVRDAAGDLIEVEELPPATVKGKTAPIQVFKAISAEMDLVFRGGQT